MPEAENYWFCTYYNYHIDQLHMQQLTYNPCLLQSSVPFVFLGLQTDNTLFLADNAFAEAKETKLWCAGFAAKDQEQLTVDKPLKFNGGLI